MSALAMLGGSPVRSGPYPDWPVLDETDVTAVADVVRTGAWGRLGGQHVLEFEQAFAAYQGAAYCLTVNSGTSALEMALLALRLPRGAEVLVPAYTYVATATAILGVGLVPVFVDIDPDTFNIDVNLIEAAITDRTVAILPVHFGGLACDMGPILDIATRRGLKVVEDAAHAHGARWNDRGLGTLGDLGCASFQASKNLNAGEGGAILTNDQGLFNRAIDYHDLWAGGLLERGGQLGLGSMRTGAGWDFPFAAGSRRLTPFQAVLLTSQLSRLEDQTRRRSANASYLNDLLEDLEGLHSRPEASYVTRNAHHVYIVRYDPAAFGGLSRERFIEAMNAEGIPIGAGYRLPLHLTGLFQNRDGELARFWPRNDGVPDINYARGIAPVAERLCAGETLWLGQSVFLDTRAGMEQVADAVEKLRSHAADLTV